MVDTLPVRLKTSSKGDKREEQSADNFSLTADTEITGIQWWGSFFDDTISNDVFDIRFFNDNTNLPANSAFETFSPVVSRSASGLFDLFGGEVFLFEVSLTPFNLLANTEYYVSIVHPADVFEDEFFWLQSDDTGSNFTRNINAGVNNDWVNSLSDPNLISGNLAFSIQGNQTVVATVSEPNTIVLFTLALLGITYFRRPINS